MLLRVLLSVGAGLLALFAGFAVGGAGHGWTYGSFSTLPLAGISLASVANALSTSPKRSTAAVLLVSGLLVCLGTAVLTLLDEGSYFQRTLERHPESIGLYVVSCLVWLGASIAPLLTVRRKNEESGS